jgi:3-deoxy-D-manno-octulosonic-acid transferase
VAEYGAALHKRKIPLVIANARLSNVPPKAMPNWAALCVAC